MCIRDRVVFVLFLLLLLLLPLLLRPVLWCSLDDDAVDLNVDSLELVVYDEPVHEQDDAAHVESDR